MKKYVYKITNLVNNKIYIGQTVNLNRRWSEHKSKSKSPVSRAIKKYGENNFTIEVLYFGDNFNEEESRYIKEYQSQNKEIGYNIADGGEDGYNSYSAITLDTAEKIIKTLLDTTLTHKEIAKKFNINTSIINHINIGETWRNNNYSYPLRKNYISDDTVNNIIELLKGTKLNFNEIANKNNVKYNVVLSINSGITHKQNDIQYPIRSRYLDQNIVNDIIDLLQNTSLTQKEIAENFDTTLSIVNKINNGKTWVNKNLKYPIRESKVSDRLNKMQVDNIINDLQNNLSVVDVAKKYKLDYERVRKINVGERYKRIGINYPIYLNDKR